MDASGPRSVGGDMKLQIACANYAYTYLYTAWSSDNVNVFVNYRNIGIRACS